MRRRTLDEHAQAPRTNTNLVFYAVAVLRGQIQNKTPSHMFCAQYIHCLHKNANKSRPHTHIEKQHTPQLSSAARRTRAACIRVPACFKDDWATVCAHTRTHRYTHRQGSSECPFIAPHSRHHRRRRWMGSKNNIFFVAIALWSEENGYERTARARAHGAGECAGERPPLEGGWQYQQGQQQHGCAGRRGSHRTVKNDSPN